MQVLHSSDDLMEELAGLCLLDPLVLHNIVEELTSTRILHD